MSALWVFLGGGCGATARWACSLWVPGPWGTMTVNIVGSFVLAFLMHPGWGLGGPWKLALGTGLMGGFTTYSTFNLELIQSLQTRGWKVALAQAALTLTGALVAGGLGWTLAGVLQPPPT